MVEQLAACGIPQDDIARMIVPGGMDPKTLRKHFRNELDSGAPKANAIIADKLFQQAKGGNITAMIFWLKTRARWRETNHHEIDMNSKNENTSFRIDPDDLPEEQREALLKVIHKRLQGAE